MITTTTVKNINNLFDKHSGKVQVESTLIKGPGK